MEVTDVQIHLTLGEGKFKGYAAVTFDDCFVVHGIKLIEEEGKFSLIMPSRKTKRGDSANIAHPINSNFRGIMLNKIVQEYESLTLEKQRTAG